MTTTAISYPFTIDAIGVVESTTLVPKIYLDRLVTLLSTTVGSRPMQPSYGTDINKYLFENQGMNIPGEAGTLSQSIEQAIRDAITTWLPDVVVDKVTVGAPQQDGESPVTIQVIVPGNYAATLSTTTSTFTPNGTVTRLS